VYLVCSWNTKHIIGETALLAVSCFLTYLLATTRHLIPEILIETNWATSIANSRILIRLLRFVRTRSKVWPPLIVAGEAKKELHSYNWNVDDFTTKAKIVVLSFKCSMIFIIVFRSKNRFSRNIKWIRQQAALEKSRFRWKGIVLQLSPSIETWLNVVHAVIETVTKFITPNSL